MTTRLSTIGELISPIQTWNPQSTPHDGTFRYIDLSSVDNEAKVARSAQEVRFKYAPSRARQLVKRGDILVSTVRPNLNGVAKLDDQHDGATASTGFCVLRPNVQVICSNYLFQWVKSPAFVSDMTRKATGQSYPAVSDRIIAESIIPLPPLDEQRRIAAVLDQADDLRRKRREALRKLEDLAEAVFLSSITSAETYIWRPLGEIIRVRSGEFLPQQNQVGTGEYAVFGGNGINGHHNQYLVEPLTIVIGRVGVYCGAIHMTKQRSWVTDNALIVDIKEPGALPVYLAAAMKHANLNQYAGRFAQPLISGGRIYPVNVPLPNSAAQRTFAARVAEIDKLKAEHRAHLEKLDTLFASLQHRAFRGEL